VEEADYLLVESTYGNRVHDSDEDGEQLATVVNEAARRGGRLIVPAFAVGRVEELLYWLKRLEDTQRIPVLPVFLDSPMAIEALSRYAARLHELDPDLGPEEHDEKAPHDEKAHEPRRVRKSHARHERDLYAFFTRRFRAVSTTEESKALTRSTAPAIIISSSGMATGGRVLHHLKAGLPDSRTTVLLVGFQAAGTRGRQLMDGQKTVKIHGQVVPVNAHIAVVASMSAHADRTEILRWLRGFTRPPRKTFLVHGEPMAMDALSASIRTDLGWETRMPEHRERIELA
jgi:metallo-beta-lactamase family protein